MRFQGQITRWEDQKGFGFITRPDDGQAVFVHIKGFKSNSRRPVVGDRVSYSMSADKNGRSRAVDVRFSNKHNEKAMPKGVRRTNSQPKNAQQKRSSASLFLVVFISALLIAVFLERMSWLIITAYSVLSLITFIAYGWDKAAARQGNWRTAESSLHLMGLIGGWPGALLAQRFFRHKSSKQEFLTMFWLTVFVNVCAIAFLVWSGDVRIVEQLLQNLLQSVF